jgi:DNA-binding beta-propeller fold protein YncE
LIGVVGIGVLRHGVQRLPLAATADSGPTLLRTLGGPNHAQIYPSGFAFAPDGTVVVADTGNDQIEKFSVTSNSYTEIWRIGDTGSGINHFNDPRDIGIDHLGNIYVADARNSRVVKLDPNGNWITSFTGPTGNNLSSELGLTVHQTAGGEFLYVADSGHNKIRVFDLSGNLLKTFVSNGVCTFNRPRDVDADAAGNVYIANYTGNNILKLDANGNCILKWGSNGTGDAQFKTPYGVEVATDPVLGAEAVYIADANNNKIKEYTTGGSFLFAMGGTGSAPGQFTEIRRVAVGPNGDAWGADLWGWRLERFSRGPTGYTYAQSVGTPLPADTDTSVFHDPHGVAFVNANLIGVMDTVHHRIVEMDPTTGHIVRTCGGRGSAVGFYNWPRGIAYDGVNNEFWVANTKQYNVHIVTPTCQPIAKSPLVDVS